MHATGAGMVLRTLEERLAFTHPAPLRRHDKRAQQGHVAKEFEPDETGRRARGFGIEEVLAMRGSQVFGWQLRGGEKPHHGSQRRIRQDGGRGIHATSRL